NRAVGGAAAVAEVGGLVRDCGGETGNRSLWYGRCACAHRNTRFNHTIFLICPVLQAIAQNCRTYLRRTACAAGNRQNRRACYVGCSIAGAAACAIAAV